MIIDELKKITPVNGVIRISEVDDTYEKLYFQVRKKERRIYTDDEVILLPYASKRNLFKDDWKLKTRSFLRFKNYLSQKSSKLNILDLRSGNGWFSGQLSNEFEHNYFCIDINLTELEQAARIFKKKNILFIYADVLTSSLPANTFDIIIINSSLQYFQNITILMKELFFILKFYGEIHIIDTPMYKVKDLILARNSFVNYYNSIGFPQMAGKYFPHSIDELKILRYEYLYKPNSIKNKLSNYIFEKDSSFPWIRLTR